MLSLLLVAMACQRVDEKTQDAAEDDVAMASDAHRVCSAGLTACVHFCGEKNDTESTAASCIDGVYSCPTPLVPAIDCGDGGITDASSGDLTADGATDGDDRGACGEQSCGAGQLCVHEYCGGGPAQCAPPGNGGACPDGWTLMLGVICPATGKAGCVPPPCQNPPPHCADAPADCAGHLDCSCIPTSVCDGIPCASVSGTDVTCGAQ